MTATDRVHAQPRNLREGGGDAERSCETCEFWSRWLSGTGDCMAYALKRRDASLEAVDREAFARDWPLLPARDTQADDVCDEWEAPKP